MTDPLLASLDPAEETLDRLRSRLAASAYDAGLLDLGFAIEDDEELSYDTAAPRRNAATLAGLAGVAIVTGALLLERACRVRSGGEEP